MEESSVEANCSPLATVEEIQRRLLRPHPLHSQSSIPFPSISSARDQNLRKQGNSSLSPINLKMNKTLEDYLNPVILSTVRAKLIGMKKRKNIDRGRELKRWEEERGEFKWPIDDLKMMFKEDSGSKRRNEEEEAVNLGDDSDLIGDGGGEGEVCCTPFGKFEVMALKKFKGGGG